jgi:hypothetical protein
MPSIGGDVRPGTRHPDRRLRMASLPWIVLGLEIAAFATIAVVMRTTLARMKREEK